MEEPSEK
jgi:hypothetical protein